ncbi:MAG: D-alanyl-D-alanine carboxypeptidase family protein [Rickettsiales bacterium]|jgi:D-alanyl-D-alanine dipeptidase|nr:D-alanyl-D-alanine carboxypeptidase family protein [Rickettsiales bacterium]
MYDDISVMEIENPARLTCLVDGVDDIFFDSAKAPDNRVRTYVYEAVKRARAYLPPHCHFRIAEAYRPLSVQIKYWDDYMARLVAENPRLSADSEELIEKCNVYVANPHRQGSGHQTGAAIDITLVGDDRAECDMGGSVDGFGDETSATDAPNISAAGRANRDILRNALTRAGLTNYPAEWWHYSFGDIMWAQLTGSKIAIFGKLDLRAASSK